MKKIAFIFSHAPHGTSMGREGLDIVFGVSSIFKEINLFFIEDGVLQLIKSNNPEKILMRNYTNSFLILSSYYDIKNFYCCKLSLMKRGLNYKKDFILETEILELRDLRFKLNKNDAIINF